MAERNSKRRDSVLTLYQQKQRHPTLCPLCDRAFFGLKLLPGCQHAYCSTCIRSAVSKNNASCKVCSQPIDIQLGDIDQLPTDEYFETLVRSADGHRQEWPPTPIDTKPVRCSLCPDDEALGGNSNNSMASSWCGQCLQYMCERCLGVHAKGSTTKQHKVDPLRDVAVKQTNTSAPNGVVAPRLNHLNSCVADCEAQLLKRQELRRRLDVVRKQIDDESNDLQQLINRNRDEVLAELETLAETETAQHVGRHLMILKCFAQYCVGEHAGEIDERIDEAVDKLKNVSSDSCPLPIAIARSLLLDTIIEVSLVRTCARRYLPQHVGDNLIGKLAVGLAASEECFVYQTWDEQASEIVNLKEQISNLQETLIKAARTESEIRNALASKISLIEQLEQDLVSSNAHGRQMEENLQRFVLQVSELKADVSNLSTEKSELQSQVQQLNEDKRGLISVQQRLTETEAKLNDEVNRMKQANAKLVEERDTLKKTRETLETNIKAKDAELKESKGQEQRLLAEIKQDRVRENELRSQLKQTEERQVRSQQQTEAAEQRINELETKFRDQLAKSQQTEAELNRSLLEANKANDNLQQRVGELIREVDQMQTETFASLKAAQQRTAEVEEQVRLAAEKESLLKEELNLQRLREEELNEQLRQVEERERSQELRVHELQKQVQQIADERIGLRAGKPQPHVLSFQCTNKKLCLSVFS
jgi:predicted  nucleic acid-binding Zn-ribbon protein